MALPDIVQAWEAGGQAGREQRTRRTLSQHLQGALGGDQAALTQIYQADPNAGMSAQKQARQNQSDSMEDAVKAANFYVQTRDPKAYQYLQGRAATIPQFAGLPATIDTPEDMEGSVKFAQAFAQSYGKAGPAELAPRVVGRSLVDATGKVLFEAPEEQDYQWSDRAGAWIPKPRAGGMPQDPSQGQPVGQMPPMGPVSEGQQITPFAPDVNIPQSSAEYAAFQAASEDANSPNPTGQPFTVGQVPYKPFQAPPGANTFGNGQPLAPQRPPQGLSAIPVAGIGPKPDISPAEERRLALAEEAAARAREAADRSRLGNAPAGFRFRADGSLEPIPGAPNATTNEGERGAFGYLGRMQAAERLLTGIEGAGYEPGGYRDTTAANNAGMPILGPLFNAATSSQGQKYRQAQEDWVRAKLRKESGAVIGDDEMAREIRVYFAQPGDDPGVIQQKAAARLQAEQQLRSMAGRAASPGQPTSPAARPAAANGPARVQSAADYDALPSGALFIAPDGTQRRKR